MSTASARLIRNFRQYCLLRSDPYPAKVKPVKPSSPKIASVLLSAVLLPAPTCFSEPCPPFEGANEDMVIIENCGEGEDCIPANKALSEYASAEHDPTTCSVASHASPWRFYDGSMRIVTLEEMAEVVRPQLADRNVKSVLLLGSWTGVPPGGSLPSLAQRLSSLLGGFPVSGMDGFVWVKRDGTHRTTRQMATAKNKGPYFVKKGEDVMASLVVGWPVEFEAEFVREGNAEGLLRAAVGWDAYLLCPSRALELFEAAAKLSSPVAAYNAALMRMERGGEEDMATATELLTRASELGDKKSSLLLGRLKSN